MQYSKINRILAAASNNDTYFKLYEPIKYLTIKERVKEN